MKRVKNTDGTITAYMSRADAFDIVEALVAQLKKDKQEITLTILDDESSAGFLDALEDEH
ncbi:MAG: hypothetical protein ACPG4U_04285 [Pseudomonadales bacterium]